MNPEERYITFRAKIDLQNFIKWHIKYIWQQSTLSDERNGQTTGSKFACFVGLTCTYARYRTRIGQNGGMCPGQFLENG